MSSPYMQWKRGRSHEYKLFSSASELCGEASKTENCCHWKTDLVRIKRFTFLWYSNSSKTQLSMPLKLRNEHRNTNYNLHHTPWNGRQCYTAWYVLGTLLSLHYEMPRYLRIQKLVYFKDKRKYETAIQPLQGVQRGQQSQTTTACPMDSYMNTFAIDRIVGHGSCSGAYHPWTKEAQTTNRMRFHGYSPSDYTLQQFHTCPATKC